MASDSDESLQDGQFLQDSVEVHHDEESLHDGQVVQDGVDDVEPMDEWQDNDDMDANDQDMNSHDSFDTHSEIDHEDVELLEDHDNDLHVEEHFEDIPEGPEDVEQLENHDDDLHIEEHFEDIPEGPEDLEELQGLGDDPDPDGDDDIDDIFHEGDDYETIFEHLCREWIQVERNHRVSKVASDAYWALGKAWFHRLFTTKSRQNIRKKTPQFTHIRRNLYKNFVPPVKLSICYQKKDSGMLTVVEDTLVTPKKQFPPHQYTKMWEIARVEVNEKMSSFLHLFSSSTACFVFRFSKSSGKQHVP